MASASSSPMNAPPASPSSRGPRTERRTAQHAILPPCSSLCQAASDAPSRSTTGQSSPGIINSASRSISRPSSAMSGHQDRKSTRLELQSLMRISYAVFCLKKKKHQQDTKTQQTQDNKQKQQVQDL